ncbi:MAG: cytochrome b/b6 domain-containing protein [Gammaproteobacteria bacterium]|nr:cytochrome b/b6 domain-containing protein [Gammaproteobacteria bacterium]
MNSETEIKVWDPLLRLFHWSLVAAFTIAYVTEDEWQNLHVWAGYAVAALIAFRLVWGFVGPQHARFSDFLFSHATIIAYLKDMVALRAKRYIGHNPAGGAMVLALLLSLSATTLSGMQLYALEENAGPFARIELNLAPVAMARADDDEDEHGGEGHKEGGVWEEIHEFFANFTLLLVVLHIAGVVVSSLAHNENLPRAMVTGKKRREL